MLNNSKLNRRKFLQAGLGAGAGLTLWNLYNLTVNNKVDKSTASLLAFKEMGIDADDMRRLLELALEKGGHYADIFLEFSVSNHMSFDGERLQHASNKIVRGAAIRVVSEDQTIFRVTEDISLENLARVARDAASAASMGERARIPAMSRLQTSNLYAANSPAYLDTLDEKQRIVLLMIRAAQKADSRVQTVKADYNDSMRFITVATSDGVIAHDTQPLLKVNLSVTSLAPETGKTGQGDYSGGGHYGLEYFKDHSPETMGRRAVDLARHQLEGVDAPTGEFPVVLGPGHSGVLLHEAVGHGLEADLNTKGYSVYSGRINQMMASELCTLYDEGSRPNLNGSINFDDEGIASSRTMLIERGRLAGYMHSRETAAKMGVAPTGNGRRQDYSFNPQPRMTNTYLQAGDHDAEEIIRSVKYGIYAKNFSGGTVNISNGDFTFMPLEAYLIELGRVTAPLSNVLLLGNGPKILQRISMVGADMEISDNLWSCGKQGQLVPVTVGTPTIKVDSITVGGALLQLG